MAEPDRIYFNGKIITVDKHSSIKQAFYVKKDKFEAVGTDDEILKYASSDTIKINLNGKTVIPGLNDGHAHPFDAATSEHVQEIAVVTCIDELLEWISKKAKTTPKGEWIIHPKIFVTRLKEYRMPSLKELDKISPDNPVFLNGSFSAVVNSKAFKISNISSETNNAGLVYDKITNKHTGVINNWSAFSLFKNLPLYPKYSKKQHTDAFIKMISLYNKTGITSYNDNISSDLHWQILEELKKENKLNARTYLNFYPGDAKSSSDVKQQLKKYKLKTGDGDEWVRMGPYKTFIDGGILTGTAYLRKPWGKNAMQVFGLSDPQYLGNINFKKENLTKVVKEVHATGWKFTAHVTGDAGADMLLDAYEELNKNSSIKDLGFSIIHVNFFHSDILDRCRNMNIFIDIQPVWFYEDFEVMRFILGEERIKCFHAYKSILDKRVTICGGSDHMAKLDPQDSINSYNPFIGIYAMVSRTTKKGNCFFPEHKISRMDALRAYTINNAHKSGEENIKGSIEAGKLADFVILKKDFLECKDEEVRDMKVETTVLGGKVVYQTKSRS